MSLKLNESYLGSFVSDAEMAGISGETEAALRVVKEGSGAGSAFLGWRDLPLKYKTEEYGRVKAAAEKIRRMCDVFVVIGIGGSYLGARAAIEFIKSPKYNELPGTKPAIYFSGNDISAAALSELLEICRGREICVNVISKSGKTTEPPVAFRVFREILEKKYG